MGNHTIIQISNDKPPKTPTMHPQFNLLSTFEQDATLEDHKGLDGSFIGFDFTSHNEEDSTLNAFASDDSGLGQIESNPLEVKEVRIYTHQWNSKHFNPHNPHDKNAFQQFQGNKNAGLKWTETGADDSNSDVIFESMSESNPLEVKEARIYTPQWNSKHFNLQNPHDKNAFQQFQGNKNAGLKWTQTGF